MCRSIAEAGDSTRRRCPIHRRDAVVAIHLAATESGLPQNVVEDLFTELRREGRHVSVSGLGGDNYSEVVTRIEEQFTDDTPQRYRDILNERNTDSPITADTLFALARIRGAALSRAGAVQERVERISRRSPRRSPAQVQSEYESLRREVDAGDPRYTPEAVAEAQENNLPTDIVSVVAFQNLQARIEAENAENAGPSRFDVEERPVERVSLRRTGSPFSEGAYDFDGGVLELTFNQGTIYRYQNIPEEVWEELRDSEEVGRYFHDHIRGDAEYQYSNITEAQEATATVHCEGCGQFVPLDGSHVCPAREDVIAARERVVAEADESEADESETDESETDESETDESETDESETDENVVESERVVPTREEVLEAWRAPQDVLSGNLHGQQTNMTYFGGRSRYDLDASDERISRYEASFSQICRTLSLQDEENMTYQRVPAEYWNQYEGTDIRVPEESAVYIPVYRNGQRGNVINMYGMSPSVPLTEYTGGEIVVISGDTHDLSSYNMSIRRRHQGYGPHYLDDIPKAMRAAHVRTYNNARFNDIDINSVDPDLRASAEAGVAERSRESDMTIGDRRASAVRVEASLPGVRRVRHAWVNVATARKLNTGEEVGGNISMQVVLGDSPAGYYSSGAPAEISGFVSMKRDESGKLQITSSERSLQCDCNSYRSKYRCEHIRRARQDILATAVEEYVGERAAQPRDPNAIPASLTRFDPSVTAVRREGRGRRRFTEMTFSALVYSPRRMTIEATREELFANQERLFDHMFLRNSEVCAPRAHILSTSLNNSDSVTFPIRVNHSDSGAINGSLTMSNTSDGNIAVDTSRLRCSCGRFTSTQTTCQHIETINRNASTVLLDRGFTERYYLPSDRFGYSPDYDVQRAYREEVAVQEMVTTLIGDPNSGFTVQDFRERRDEVVAAARARHEELHAERLRAEAAARAEQERLQAEYERQRIDRATRDRLIQEVNFYQQNPGLREEHESYRELAKQRWEEAEPSQFDSITTIKEKIDDYKSQGTRALTTKTEGVTFGICDPNVPGSRRFGIELEFDLPSGPGKSEKLSRIAQQLYQAGLTSSSRQEGYHSGARNGYQKWSFERDATVDGEIVSPILDDSPETWEQVQKVLEIVKANGGRASARAGSHVHVSSSSYVDSSAKKAEMIRLVQEHEAVIYRAAANPSTGRHRGTTWCGPNPEVHGVVAERDVTRIGHSSHHYGVNLESANNMTRGANVEVRMWDSTLDLAAIQQQVAISAALVDRAEYNVERDGESTPRDSSDNFRVGSSFTEARGHEGVKKFLEDLIPTQEGRENALHLISLNGWSR